MLIKTKEEIKLLKKGGKILGEILSDLALECRPGVATWEIDRLAEEMILQAGGKPAFKFYKNHPTEPPFPATICASFNEEIVHGIPRRDLVLKNGDMFSIDIGMEWPASPTKRGLFTDTAITLAIGSVPAKTRELMRVTAEALEVGIRFIKPGVNLADLGKAIEDFVKSQGKYGIIRDLSGHGVGHAVHEDPWIPNYYERSLEKFILKPGMVLALEPMITLGGWRIITASDGWTIKTADGSLCAHSEHTVVVTAKGCEVITRRPEEK
ncbi:MAG: type I methionyl aminopeptidase [Patescibacteria group bacterium]|nr:type I methionyl aminopeptidase [Patescibacteria group bacterium]